MTKQQILDEVRKLPQVERYGVAMDVWSLVESDSTPLSSELRAELDRRLLDDDADGAPSEDWRIVRERLLRGEI